LRAEHALVMHEPGEPMGSVDLGPDRSLSETIQDGEHRVPDDRNGASRVGQRSGISPGGRLLVRTPSSSSTLGA